MTKPEGRAKDRIRAAAIELLRRDGLDQITVRRIADEAGVGVGLINYHFGSKDELLIQAVKEIVGLGREPGSQPWTNPEIDPQVRLRSYLRTQANLLGRHTDLLPLLLERRLLEEEFDNVQQLVALLREMLPGRIRELDIRLLAFAIAAAVDLALMRHRTFQRFSGIDMLEQGQREMMLDTLIDRLIATQLDDQA
jgi:AcrR family transcriptional regulator